jgi:hypothetical protein
MGIQPESRARFEKQGVFLTKLSLQDGYNVPPPEKREAIEWLAEEEHEGKRRDAARYRLRSGFTIVAALAAVIAAVPVLKDWLMK